MQKTLRQGEPAGSNHNEKLLSEMGAAQKNYRLSDRLRLRGTQELRYSCNRGISPLLKNLIEKY